MSLDVYLTIDEAVFQPAQIYVREDGQTRAISRDEWDSRFPGREPLVMDADVSDEVYSDNITHNLSEMAADAGIYKHLWRPDEIGVTKAEQLVEPLRTGLNLLLSDPKRFRAFNPKNGWGSYEGLVQFVHDYLRACEAHPKASVSVSR